MLPVRVLAQEDGSMPATPPAIASAQQVAKEALNPFSQSFKLPLEAVTGFRVGPDQKAGENLNIEPVLPLSVGQDWTVIVQPLLAGEYLPSPDATTGLQDFQTSVFLTPARTGAWVWGAGPIIEVPSATDSKLGTGKWSAGPTGAVVYSEGPWVNGVLVSHLASFAGNHHRTSVNLTSLEAQVSYTFDDGWYVQTNPTTTYDWSAAAWTVPVGADVGKGFSIGTQGISLQVGAYDLVARAAGDPAWIFRVQATLLIPTGE
jgi:hypothetical protein